MLEKLRFKASLWFWARLIPALAWKRTLNSLLPSIITVGPMQRRNLSAEYIVRRVKKVTRRPILMRDRPCLRDGLLAMRFLKQAGYDPKLHFGVDRESIGRDILSAHCWVVVDGKVMLNPPSPGMVEILVYDGGQLIPPKSARSIPAMG